MIWQVLYPNEKDPQLLLSWTRYAGLAVGVFLYALAHKRLRLARLKRSIVALFVAVCLGLLSSLAGICWAVWLRTS